jgi:DNA modification methylase
MYVGSIESFLGSGTAGRYHKQCQLLLTSPPFPLNRQKDYGNRSGGEYMQWLMNLAPRLAELVRDDGSIVIEMGNAWVRNQPTMTTLTVEALLGFLKSANLHLCQQFIAHNHARLPSPVEWVNKRRIRVKDSFTHIWWMSKGSNPKADNRKVLARYSDAMRKLLETGRYNDGRRPSGHRIGTSSFLRVHGGAIPSNVLTYSNTTSNEPYRDYCLEHGLPVHPARMPEGIARFFIEFLTDSGDLVLDPFAGSNTTGATADKLDRRWLSVEQKWEYVDGSMGRFNHVRLSR